MAAQVVRLEVQWIGDVYDSKEPKEIEGGNVFNEIAEISEKTMKKNGLDKGYLLISNANNSYSKIVALISRDKQPTHQDNTVYINRNVMANVGVSVGDTVKVSIVSDPTKMFGKAPQITVSQIEDSSYSVTPVQGLKSGYLKPYFQENPTENSNFVVKKGEVLKIKGKKFKVMDFTYEDKDKESKAEFALINNKTTIQCKAQIISANATDNDSSLLQQFQFKVKTLTSDVLAKHKINKELNFFDTTILLSKEQKSQLFRSNQSKIVYIRGKNGKYLYCKVDENECKVDDDAELYLNEVMQFNLNINQSERETENKSETDSDTVTVSINRQCKRMTNQKASRILVTPILKADVNTNDDYNDDKVMINQYLKPYFSPNEISNDFVIGNDQIFSTFNAESKSMDFLVMEIEAFDAEDSTHCVVDGSTEIEVDIDGIQYSEIKSLNLKKIVSFDADIGFLDNEWAKLCNLIDSNNSANNNDILQTNGVLLHGPSGTGKTFLMQAITNKYSDSLSILSISGPTDILSSEIGESERKLKRAFKHIINNAPGILFIDDIDSILCYSHIKSALIGLMNSYKNSQILIIAATNKINDIDVSLRRGGLFEEEIMFNIPDAKGRQQILEKMVQSSAGITAKQIEDIARKTNGFVGADLNQLCGAAKKDALLKNEKLEFSHFEHSLQFIVPSSVKDIAVVEKPNIGWEDIGGMEQIKEKMQEMIENPLKYGHVFDKYGESGSRGCLLWGPPGNGKTFLGKAIATKCDTNFVYVKGPELLSKFHGESEENIRNLFRKARSVAPTILFFDELDALAPVRGKSGNSTSDRVVNQLLAEMDGISKTKQNSKEKQIFYLGATNRPDMIDPALKRPGRLEQMIYINLPNPNDRKLVFKAILKKIKKKKPNVVGDIDDEKVFDFDALSEKTERFSAADIKGIIDKAINALATAEIKVIKENEQKMKESQSENSGDSEEMKEEKQSGNKYEITGDLLLEIIQESSPSVRKTEAKMYDNLQKQYTHQYSKKNENPLYFVENIKEALDVKDFVDEIFGKDTLRAQEIYEFFINPQKAALDSLDDLCEMERQDFEELCYELKIKYGHKVKFNRAFNKLKRGKMEREQAVNARNKKGRKQSNAKRNSMSLAQSRSPKNPPQVQRQMTMGTLGQAETIQKMQTMPLTALDSMKGGD